MGTKHNPIHFNTHFSTDLRSRINYNHAIDFRQWGSRGPGCHYSCQANIQGFGVYKRLEFPCQSTERTQTSVLVSIRDLNEPLNTVLLPELKITLTINSIRYQSLTSKKVQPS